MSTMIIDNPLPKGWDSYDLHIVVNEQEYELIKHLEKTKWEHFANGGVICGTSKGIDTSGKTRWYGLRRNDLSIIP